VLVGLDGDENADTEVQPFRIEQRDPPFDVARLFELLDPALARRRARAHPLGNLLHRKTGVHLQRRQDLAIELVEHFGLRFKSDAEDFNHPSLDSRNGIAGQPWL
jgi:hypothetical protein